MAISYGPSLASGDYDINAPYVMLFRGDEIGAAGHHVSCGEVFADNAAEPDSFGKFWWEWWGCNLGGGYVLAESYGGAHALLIGHQGSNYSLQGNILGAGGAITTFLSDARGAVGEWAHYVYDWDGTTLRVRKNGIVRGETAYAGLRRTQGRSGGGGHLNIGGTDHVNYKGKVAYIAAYDDNYHPVADVGGNANVSQVPGRFPRADQRKLDNTYKKWEFIMDFRSGPQSIIPDLGSGIRGSTHPGQLYNPEAGCDMFGFPNNPTSGLVLPTWVKDPTCPLWLNAGGPTAPTKALPTAPTVSGSPLAYDTFSRADETYAFKSPGNPPDFGSTEGGSLGRLTWQTSLYPGNTPTASRPRNWGIMDGQAVYLDSVRGIAWVDVETANHTVSVKNCWHAAGTRVCGLVFRVLDDENFWYAFMDNETTCYLRSVEAGAQTSQHGGYAMGASWEKMEIVCNGTTITVKSDGVQVGQITGQTVLQNATGCGLYAGGSGNVPKSLQSWREWRADAS